MFTPTPRIPLASKLAAQPPRLCLPRWRPAGKWWQGWQVFATAEVRWPDGQCSPNWPASRVWEDEGRSTNRAARGQAVKGRRTAQHKGGGWGPVAADFAEPDHTHRPVALAGAGVPAFGTRAAAVSPIPSVRRPQPQPSPSQSLCMGQPILLPYERCCQRRPHLTPEPTEP